MGDVIKFDNSYNENNAPVFYIFIDVVKQLRRMKEEIVKDFDNTYNELDYLESYIYYLAAKIRIKNWKSSELQDLFISKYHYFKETTLDIDDLLRVYYLSELIYFTDLESGLVKEDNEYITYILKGLDNNLDNIKITDKESIKRILKSIRKPIIKELFKYEIDETFKMIDIIDSVYNKVDLFTISTWYHEDPEDEYKKIIEDDLLNGILTIDRVYNYYVEQQNLCYLWKLYKLDRSNKKMSVEESLKHKDKFDTIDKMVSIKSYSERSRFNYLYAIREIASKKSINEEIEDITNLTKFYIKHKKDIDNYSMNQIRKIYKKAKKKVLKNENR